MTNNFNRDNYDLAVAIYQYADFSVNNPSHITYATQRMENALSSGVNWISKHETYKGSSQKRKGTATVTVEMADGTSYGFWMHAELAKKIYDILHAKWMEIYSQGN